MSGVHARGLSALAGAAGDLPREIDELWTTPAEAGRRLDALVAGWNRLAAVVLGRGATPPPGTPDALAQRTRQRYAAFRAWYDDAREATLSHLLGEFHGPMQDQVKEFNATLREARASLDSGRASRLPRSAPEQRAHSTLGAIAKGVAMGVLTSLLTVGLLSAIRGRR